ncbi:MAG: hypothetical protein HDT44_08465 [Ruminococcaceae bacterium]|nr:hypothetical protein [Oscillospiraceae bacterium]
MPKGQHLAEKPNKRKNENIEDSENSENRSKKTNRMLIANTVVIGSVFAAITVSMLVFTRPTISMTEKRELAKFPEFSFEDFFSGKYTSGITEWYDDTVPWRDGFKDIAANISKCMGVSLGGVTIHGTPNKVVNPVKTDAPDTTVPENSQAPAQTSQQGGDVTGENTQTQPVQETEAETQAPQNGLDGVLDAVVSNGQIVFDYQGHAWGVSLYGGGYNQQKYADSVNAFAEDLEGIANVYSMVAPTNGDFYCPTAYKEYNASQYDDIVDIASRLSGKVTNVDCYSAIQSHLDEDLYFRTDHHWQPLAAYYAAEQFAKAAEVPFLELNEDNFEYHEIDDFVGSVYSATKDAALLNDPDLLKYYIPNNYYKDEFVIYYYNTHYEDEMKYPFFQKDQHGSGAYCVFMGGDTKIVRVDTDVKNGRKLLVFKDSYGNAEIPFYMNSFEQIYVCDVRFFPLNAIDFIKEQGVTDVLFTMNTFSAAGSNADGIEVSRLGQGPLLDWGQD